MVEMKNYVKIPRVVQAIRASAENIDDIYWDILGGAEGRHQINYTTHEYADNLSISTLEGEMKLNVGDWLIKGIEGEFYPCSDSVFQKSYRIAETIEKPWSMTTGGTSGTSSIDFKVTMVNGVEIPPDDEGVLARV